ncbi:CPBP family glutamic-type intramembrane protease [Nocardioides sp. YIM 152315]|uniref:CPBP family glutamic-type intramembrane protease n=1 Tax=Nocardioides sp. YIM 152315 TaxID=3031760 RepID=UPI0023DA6A9B|nr:CPBP family glutamic-type intramembrane protease [Nocardioides sp. YIM 152315]MDF1604343.1 CPBP family glutamic-type intramembrane protease [Nocardioides sp. YIM 152315]
MTEDRRRRQVVGGLVVLGTLMLGVSFRTEPGSTWFYPAALGLAAVWALGAVLAGPVPLGDPSPWRPLLVGLGLGVLFVAGAVVVREIPALDDLVASVTEYAERGSGLAVALVAVVTGVAEEVFFRGALYDVVPRPVVTATLLYTVVTLATGNAMLVLAAALLGAVAGLVRQRSGGVVAPAVVHATWSIVMILALPVLF